MNSGPVVITLNDMEPMKAALLMSHGFNDWNVVPVTQSTDLRSSKSKRHSCSNILPPEWTRRTAANENDEPVVYTLSAWYRERS